MKALRLSVTSFAVIALAASLLVHTLVCAADGSQTSKAAGDTLLAKDQRKAAPEFSLTDAEGKPIDLANYRGKVVLLDFWATWCGGCKLEIPWYMEFDTKYKRQGLAVIGVSMDEDGWKAVRPFLAQKRDPETGGNTAMKYPVVIGNDTLAKQYNLTSMPMTLLIDREGKIALSHTGVVNKDDFEGHIRQLLQ
jgi:peroxiredoxin